MIKKEGYRIERRVLIDGLWYICHLSYSDTIEHWSVSNAKKLSEYLTEQGFEVIEIDDSGLPQRVDVDTTIYHFLGEVFHLNQCEDLIEWTQASVVGEFSYYYDKIVFHTSDGFVAAYRDDINNNWKF